MTRRLVLLLAVTCAVAVGNLYFPQAVGPLIAAGLHVPPDAATLVVTATQLGYTGGIVLLVPLGDRLPHRPLLVTLLSLTGLALLAAGCAPNLPVLVAASAAVGLTTVAAQIVGTLAANLTSAGRRGAVIGALLSGSTGGMLLARTFGGTLGQWLGWRAPYLVAAALTLLLAAVLARTVPATAATSRQPYRALLAEPLRLLRTEPELRRSCIYQASVFAGFSAVWTCLALLLTGPPYDLDARAVGLLALVGAATMLCTPYAGRLVDRHGPDPVNLVCLLGVLAAAAVLATGSHGGPLGLTALTLGTLLLDVPMQCGMVANQTRVDTLRPEARGRLRSAYMTCAYLGGSTGSWLGTRVWTRTGWWGVCTLLALLTMLALTRHLTARPRTAPSTPEDRQPPPRTKGRTSPHSQQA
ncbi:MFS transporter [Streptomyces sp. 1331.2]|uniref:MFS transporter n=1 Tax=Streptomyces sp. 1331.2 TaxID=1938835 RepID=UPI000BCC3519|nr:MFS transporter [Streptomyces sp. 1331.2]SOB86305.1 Predicted arabinose efflux permease, MFS family [Streptomyces sp. 1331.2]